MAYDFECRKCGCDLERWNVDEGAYIRYCPNCGAKLLKKQAEELHGKTTEAELDGKIRGSVLELLENCGEGVCIDELAHRAWESENADGVVFYSNYKADMFVQRHSGWVDEALEYVGEEYGDSARYAQMKAECNDRFLVVAFIEARQRYLYFQLGLDTNGEKLTKRRIAQIKRQVKDTPYNAEW